VGANQHVNVILVLTDDQGYGDLACHGNPYIRTPHLDRLWSESVRFTNFHVAPTCSPTRAGLLTGHFANATGVWHTIGGRSLLRRDERTLADFLSAAGYATGLFGKWHLGDAFPYRPQDRGFQEVVTHGGGGVGNTPDYWGNNYADDTYCHNGTWEPFAGYCTDVWFRLALDFVERQAQAQTPFFCFISTNAPHSPHIAPERYVRPYRDLAESNSAAARFFNYPASDQMLKFYGMVTCIDENVGALRARLDQLGLAENTVLLFMTDNGSAGGLALDRERFVLHGFNAGMRGGKGTPYEGGHRVPFFLRWPGGGFATGRDEPTLAANVDVLPTILDLCGVPYDAGAYHGRSLAPLLRGTTSTQGDMSQTGQTGQADMTAWPERSLVVDSQRLLQPVRWRLSCVMRQEGLRASGEPREWRLINGRYLYDLRRDPEQRHDLATEHPEVVQRLRSDYESWWRLVSSRLDEEIPIRLGDPAAPLVTLTSHDWRRDPGDERVTGAEAYGDDVRSVWNQAQVHQGIEFNGYWEVEIARTGTYRFELRRWPREAGLGLTEGIPGEPKPYNAIEDGYGGGRALPLQRAAVRVGRAVAESPLDPAVQAVTLELDLPAGPAHLETLFSGSDGLALGAYYVTVEYVT
jgi:arylsulfatase A-like enzyme